MAGNKELKMNSGKYFWVSRRHLPSGTVSVRAAMPGVGEVTSTCLCLFNPDGLKRANGGFSRDEGGGQSTGLLDLF